MALLTKKQIAGSVVLGAAIVTIGVGGYLTTTAQTAQIARLRSEAGSSVGAQQVAQRKAEIKRAKRMKKEIARWKVLRETLESFIPADLVKGVSYERALSSFPSGMSVPTANQGAQKELSWSVPKKEGEGEGGEAASEEAAPAVKYKEREFSFTAHGDYGSWLQYLANLEGLRAFYRLKEVTMKSSPGTANETTTPLVIELKLAGYFGVQFPEKKEGEGTTN